MMAVEQPTPIHKKMSLFRRFTFKEPPHTRPVRPVHPLALPTPPPSPPSSSFEPQPRSPRKLQRRASLTNLPTPPSSPPQVQQDMPRRRKQIEKSSIGRPKLIVQDTYQVQLPRFDFEQRHYNQQYQHQQQYQKPQHTRHDSTQSYTSLASSSSSSCSIADDTYTSSSSLTPQRDHHQIRVLPTAIPTHPFTSHPQITPWNIFLPPSHTYALYLGFLPSSSSYHHPSSNQWFIYSQGPDTLGKLKVHFHRANGVKVAELFVVMDVKGEGAGKIVGVKWDASVGAEGRKRIGMNENEAKSVVRGACEDVLGVRLEEGI